MNWLAPAKINLSLRVLGRREDGFHELETLMAPLDLADEITLSPDLEPLADASSAFRLTCSDPTLPTGRENLALRAAELFQKAFGKNVPPTHIALQKNVPHGAGLGGGSSDAATVLLALNEHCKGGLSISVLSTLAAELGSDVPFFLHRSAAVCRGRGEWVEPAEIGESLSILLLKPAFPVLTPWAYKNWSSSTELSGVNYAAQSFGWGEMVNDLERPVFQKYLLLPEMKMWLLEQPEVKAALMSGSGSTMIALLARADGAEHLAIRAKSIFGELWTCRCSTTQTEK